MSSHHSWKNASSSLLFGACITSMAIARPHGSNSSRVMVPYINEKKAMSGVRSPKQPRFPQESVPSWLALMAFLSLIR